jgi:c-di-AMP phosphodiesterase-like protein
MYSIFLIMFVSFMSWLSKFLILILELVLICFLYSLSKEKKLQFHIQDENRLKIIGNLKKLYKNLYFGIFFHNKRNASAP